MNFISMAVNSIVANLNKGENLTEHNYDTWSCKVQYVLEDQELLEVLTQTMQPPKNNSGTAVQQKRDLEAFNTWKKKIRAARIILLSSMKNDLMLRFECHHMAKELWDAVKLNFGGTSVTRRRHLQMRFDNYKKKPNYTMAEHITAMSNMISELRYASHELTDEQQVQAMIRSIPEGWSWDSFKQSLTHDNSIRTFDDVARHLGLEKDRLQAKKSVHESYVIDTEKRGQKRNRGRKEGSFKSNHTGQQQKKKGKRVQGAPKRQLNQRRNASSSGKKNKSKTLCFNCRKSGHFARDCPENQTQQQQST